MGPLSSSNHHYRYHKIEGQNHQIWARMINLTSGRHDQNAAKPQ
jgi:hypothetical protein